MACGDRRHAAGDDLWSVVTISHFEGRSDRERVDPRGCHFPDAISHPVAGLRAARRHDPRTQHHTNRWLGRRIHRVRRGGDDARHPDPRFRLGIDARGHGRRAWRVARHSDDDSLAPRIDRQGARGSQIPGRHRLRGRAEGWCVGGGPRGGVTIRATRDPAGPRSRVGRVARRTGHFRGFRGGLALQGGL